MQVPVRELKAHLSEYLRRAGAGEEVVITSHGRPMARLVPPNSPQPADQDAEAAAIARIRALPFVIPGNGGSVADIKPIFSIPEGETTMAELVCEERR
ncbi:type II toxin-antitoxin system Phd/YefM family antitoxin [Endothiovibrio diazotrophicus]